MTTCCDRHVHERRRWERGIYGGRFEATTNAVTLLRLAGETDSPGWVVVHPNKRFLYATNDLPPREAGEPAGAVVTAV